MRRSRKMTRPWMLSLTVRASYLARRWPLQRVTRRRKRIQRRVKHRHCSNPPIRKRQVNSVGAAAIALPCQQRRSTCCGRRKSSCITRRRNCSQGSTRPCVDPQPASLTTPTRSVQTSSRMQSLLRSTLSSKSSRSRLSHLIHSPATGSKMRVLI